MDGSSNELTSTPVVLARGGSTFGSPKPIKDNWQSSKSDVGKPLSMSREEAKRKIKAMVDEYWAVRDKKVRLLLTNTLSSHCCRAEYC